MYRIFTTIRAAIAWIFGSCPLCLSLGRILPMPDAPPTERFYVPCPLCEYYSPQNIYNWWKREQEHLSSDFKMHINDAGMIPRCGARDAVMGMAVSVEQAEELIQDSPKFTICDLCRASMEEE